MEKLWDQALLFSVPDPIFHPNVKRKNSSWVMQMKSCDSSLPQYLKLFCVSVTNTVLAMYHILEIFEVQNFQDGSRSV